jgi:hypothetical protein
MIGLYTQFMQWNLLYLDHPNYGPFMHTLGHVHAEPESDYQAEQVQVEDVTSSFPKQGKHRCILAIILVFYFNTTHNKAWLCIKFIGVDWYHRCIMFNILDYPCLPFLVVVSH